MRIALLALVAALAAGDVRAESEILSCQTVEGRTTCVRATGNVSCVTIDGETRCTRLDEGAELPPLPEISLPCIDVDAAGWRVRTGCPPPTETE